MKHDHTGSALKPSEKLVPVPDPVPAEARSHIVLVLGMHRSGTSVLTRGLSVLGIDLGDKLMPPAAGNNEKGFFEDMEVVDLNERLLAQMGRQWHSLEPIEASVLEGPDLFDLRVEATALLNSRLSRHSLFGLKDPRMSVLMPFWHCVLDNIDADVSYVLALRNPLASAQSLRVRDGISLEKGVALWGTHMLHAARASESGRRVIVSFDDLLNRPMIELNRVATALGLAPVRPVDPKLNAYLDNFLETELRHYSLGEKELGRSGRAMAIVTSLYGRLIEAASTSDPQQPAKARIKLNDIASRFEDLRPLFRALDAAEADKASLHTRIMGLSEQLASLKTAHDAACEQRDEATLQYKALSGRAEELETQHGIVQAAHDAACEQRDDALSNLKSSLERFASAQEAEAALQCQLASEVLQREEVEARLSQDQASFAQQTSEWQAELQSLHAQLGAQLSLIDTLQVSLEDEAARTADQIAENGSLRLRLNTLEGTLVVLSAQLEEAGEANGPSGDANQKLPARRGQVPVSSGEHQSETIRHLQETLLKAQADIRAYQTSTSWKLTAPMRGMRRLVTGRGLKDADTRPQRPPAPVSAMLWKTALGKVARHAPKLPPAAAPELRAERGQPPPGPAWLGVAIHAFYPDLLDDILARLALTEIPVKLYVTAPLHAAHCVRSKLEAQAHPFSLFQTDNRGRDIAPFLVSLSALVRDGAPLLLKIHTKASEHLANGARWRQHLLDTLLSGGAPERALEAFSQDPALGLLAPDGHVLAFDDFLGTNAAPVTNLMHRLGIRQSDSEDVGFVAGSMFYARPIVFDRLIKSGLSAHDFSMERGEKDGTLAHAAERVVGLLVKQSGLRLSEISAPETPARPLRSGMYQFV